jgi:type IV pilus assembly protein PilV
MSVIPKKRIARGPRRCTQRGSMMVEVLVSVVLLSVSVLGLVRILAQSVKDSGELEYRSVASTLADQAIGRMWVMDPAGLGAYAAAQTGTTNVLPNGTRAVAVNGNVVAVTITWQAPGSAVTDACGVVGASSCYQSSATLARNP